MSNPNEVSMKEEIMQAVARGWCSKENEHKEMDVILASAIAGEVQKIYFEKNNMQLVAIMTATLQNTESTIKERLPKDHEYWTVAYGDVCRAIDREMELIKKCKNLDEVIGSLDVKNPDAVDALLNVQLKNQGKIAMLESQLAAERVKVAGLVSALEYIEDNCDGDDEQWAKVTAEEAIKKYGESGILKTRGEKYESK